jgi:K+-sensing histidine kinase KdpD
MIHYPAGMGVELSKALNILAHELRGPLGVIQGYLRLLRQRRAQDEDDTRMITAMQDATGRIAALGRQTVDLAATLDHPPVAHGHSRVTDIIDLAVRHAALPTAPAVRVPDAVGGATVRSVDSAAVGAALAAVLQAVSKDAAGAPVAIVGTERGEEIELRLGPVESVHDDATDDARDSRPEALRLERGGLGLSLVLASYVFDAIGARLTSIAPDGSGIAVALRKDGGLQ